MAEVNSFLAGQNLWSRAFYRLGRSLVVGVIYLLSAPRVIGRENIPRHGAYVLAPIHRSYLDTPLAAIVTRRRLRFMGKDSMWRNRIFGWVLSALGAFPVSRGTADREALKRCVQVLQGGEPLVLFPEGERKSGDKIAPLFDGAAFVAVRAGVPIIPVGIGGSERLMPKGAKLPRFSRCRIVIGAPIPTMGCSGDRVSRSAVREITLQLQKELQVLFDQASK